jgi:hypothetical protein
VPEGGQRKIWRGRKAANERAGRRMRLLDKSGLVNNAMMVRNKLTGLGGKVDRPADFGVGLNDIGRIICRRRQSTHNPLHSPALLIAQP